jgi:hypothetical protein
MVLPKRYQLLCERAKNHPENSDNDKFGWWFFGFAVDLINMVDAHTPVIGISKVKIAVNVLEKTLSIMMVLSRYSCSVRGPL